MLLLYSFVIDFCIPSKYIKDGLLSLELLLLCEFYLFVSGSAVFNFLLVAGTINTGI